MILISGKILYFDFYIFTDINPSIFLFVSFSKILMHFKDRAYGNRIQVSGFGISFLKQLPYQLTEIDDLTNESKENVSMMINNRIKRRGKGVNFYQFANQTQSLITKEVGSMLRVQSQNLDRNQSKRKQILHHNNWINEQKLVQHKIADSYTRLEQMKSSEYNWRKQGQKLKKEKYQILNEWQSVHLTRSKRMMSKLKKIMQKKYPTRNKSSNILLKSLT